MASIFNKTFVIRDQETGLYWTRGHKFTDRLDRAWQWPTESAAKASINATFKREENRKNHAVLRVIHDMRIG